MRKRKSFEVAPGIKLNATRRGLTSVTVGPRGARVNVRLSDSRRGRRGTSGAQRAEESVWTQIKGVRSVSIPITADDYLDLTVDVIKLTAKRLLTIKEATEKNDLKTQGKEFFTFVKEWDFVDDKGRPEPRNQGTLEKLPKGFALAISIEVANRTGLLKTPSESGLIINNASPTSQPIATTSPSKEPSRSGCLSRLLPFKK